MIQSSILLKNREVHQRTAWCCEPCECTGTSGIIVPFCKTYGLYFSDKPEPESGKFDIEKMTGKFDEKNKDSLLIDPFGTFEEYRTFTEKVENINKMTLSSKPAENTNKLYININKPKDDEI